MLELRDASDHDEPWLRHLFSVSQPAMAALISLPDGVGEALVAMQYAARQAHFQAHWPRAVQRLIEWRDGSLPDRTCPTQAVGALWVHEGEQGMHVLDIAVLPAWRGRGIGTRCLQALLVTAGCRQLPVTLQVDPGNPARRLYERLGFVPTGTDDGTHLPMICRPQSRRARFRPAPLGWRERELIRDGRTSNPPETCNEQA